MAQVCIVNKKWIASFLTLLLFSSSQIFASTSLTDEPEGGVYNFVTYYRISIDAPVSTVWHQIVDLPSWMYDFELSNVSGEPGKEGEVLRLYEGQDFQIQIIKIVPNQLLLVANLPLNFKGELSQGIGAFSLHETSPTQTTVDLIMRRRYTWMGEGNNPIKATRQSKEFVDGTNAMWRDKFLARLKSLSEAK